LHEAGARLAFAYQGERLKENVEAPYGGRNARVALDFLVM